jgi:hypothetical protein
MWLDAIVTSSDIQALVDQLTPATIPLGERGHLFFDAPADVSLVADRGLRLRCHAKLAWPVLGIEVAVTIKSMTLLVIPSVESRDGEQVIVFSPEVDALDLALVPDIGDAEIRAFINRALLEKRIELPWNYRETLGHQFPLPDWFGPGAAFGVRPNGAAIKVTNDTMGLAIGFHAGVEPTAQETDAARNGAVGNGAARNGIAENGTAESWRSPNTPRKATALTVRRKRSRLVGLGVAVLGGFGVGWLVGLWGTNRN